MANYRKPVVSALSMDSEQNGCCFFITNSGEGVFIYNGEGGQAGNRTLVAVGDNSVQVTPLCGTGLPATQPIIIGAPVGVTGVSAQVSQGQPPHVGIAPDNLGVSVLGLQVGL